ncbi:MAG: alcohol dehydrogenase catalytic domain-containing protein [Spirochaetes bacterium]|nr:alcohol dehydrogenase catalytic domain-containing protein [Spirochaetota bacterium]
MRAVMLTGPKKMECVTYEMPRDDGNHVIIRVSACGICGSDMHYWESGIGMHGSSNIILGHEFCGRVYSPGNRSDLQVGDRVAALPIDPCGQCYSCRIGAHNICSMAHKRNIIGNNVHGAYAEYVCVRPDMVRKLPEAIDDKEGALIEPAAVALHAIHQAHIQKEDRVLVIGGGPIGLLCALWAKAYGAVCVVVVEIDQFRKSFAEGFPAIDAVIDANDPDMRKKLKLISDGGFTVAMETSATDAGIHTATMALTPKGRLVLAGINFQNQSVPTLLLIAKEIIQIGSMGYTVSEFDSVIEACENKVLAIAPLVTHTVMLDQLPYTMTKLYNKSIDAIKIVVTP